MRYSFVTADVFTDQLFGGNPLAVLPDARELTEQRMQQIALEFNLAETAFVLPPRESTCTRRIRIFTPERELPFAGHPTIGTAVVLAAIGKIPLTGSVTSMVFEEGIGAVPVRVYADAGQVRGAQLSLAAAPQFGPPPPEPHELATMLGLEMADLGQAGMVPAAVSCGVPYLLVPLASTEALGRARLDLQRWQNVLAGSWAPQLYPFTRTGDDHGRAFQARMFAPGLGVPEDPATGSAAAALAAYLGSRTRSGSGTHRWTISQGGEMGRPGRLLAEVDLRGGEPREIRVGGDVVLVSEGRIRVG